MLSSFDNKKLMRRGHAEGVGQAGRQARGAGAEAAREAARNKPKVDGEEREDCEPEDGALARRFA